MRKIKLLNDTYIQGYGRIAAGTEFKVERYNTRYVYVKLGVCELQLTRKEVEKVY